MKLNLYPIGKSIEAFGRAIADIAQALERKPEPEPAKPAPKPKTDLPFKVDDVVKFKRDCFFGKVEPGDTALIRDIIGDEVILIVLTGKTRGMRGVCKAQYIIANSEVVKVKA